MQLWRQYSFLKETTAWNAGKSKELMADEDVIL